MSPVVPSAATAIVTRGPNASPLSAASGARSTEARNCTVAVPILKLSPGLSAVSDSFTPADYAQLDRIAANVARAQAIASQTGSAGRYGYAIRPEDAPHSAWSQALDAHLARSRRRIASARLFDVASADIAQRELDAMRDEIDSIPPTPFLHDTTTRNVIVTEEGAFSGIVDVDDLCFGDPRYPAALTLAVLTAGCALLTRSTGAHKLPPERAKPPLRDLLFAPGLTAIILVSIVTVVAQDLIVVYLPLLGADHLFASVQDAVNAVAHRPG